MYVQMLQVSARVSWPVSSARTLYVAPEDGVYYIRNM